MTCRSKTASANITGPFGGVLTITHHSAISAFKTTVV